MDHKASLLQEPINFILIQNQSVDTVQEINPRQNNFGQTAASGGSITPALYRTRLSASSGFFSHDSIPRLPQLYTCATHKLIAAGRKFWSRLPKIWFTWTTWYDWQTENILVIILAENVSTNTKYYVFIRHKIYQTSKYATMNGYIDNMWYV
jgi:hypothetical protein